MRRAAFVVIMLIMALVVLTSPLLAGHTRNVRAHLAAAPGVETRAQGQAKFQFSAGGTAVTFRLIVANIENITMAHIHVAQETGGSGPVAVWLYPAAPPAQLIPGRFNGTLATGTITAADLRGPLAGQTLESLRLAIMEGRAYVNVHTVPYPAGEIRGYLW